MMGQTEGIAGEHTAVGVDPVRAGDHIRIQYRLTLQDGTLVDSSDDDGPLELVVGDGTLHPGLEETLIGIMPGERRVRVIPPEQGFGFSDPDLHHHFARDEFPDGVDPVPGLVMSFTVAGGEEIPGTVTALDDDRVEVDLNHPLAGHSVCFEVELAIPQPGAD